MKLQNEQEAIKDILNICESGQWVTIATDIVDFSWFAPGKISPFAGYVPRGVNLTKTEPLDTRELYQILTSKGLKFENTGAAVFHYYHK